MSPALVLSHHAHLPPFLQILGWGEAPKGDQRPAIWSHVPVNHSSLRLERGKARYMARLLVVIVLCVYNAAARCAVRVMHGDEKKRGAGKLRELVRGAM